MRLNSRVNGNNNYRFIYLLIVVTILLTLDNNNASGQGVRGKTFVVSPAGSDSNPGTIAQPLATLEAARDAARAAGNGSHRIIVMPGDYYLARTFELDFRDNGLTIEADTSGQVILYGGTLVTGWRRDGDKFWCTDLPGVKEGTWDFRALVVNGRMPERARLPESGTFLHLSEFNVAWLGTVGGGFARKATQEELTTMIYDPKDVPGTLDINNAEVRVYHSWDESLVGVAHNDVQNHKLIFSSPTIYPPGGGGWEKKYIIYNIREGMTKPGRWYLDRTKGQLVYWPLEGEDMSNAKIIAPTLQSIVRITGEPDKKAENITIRGLSLQATSIPLKSAGMGANSNSGALNLSNAQQCNMERLEITNVGGLGFLATQMVNCRITDCHIHNVGRGGVTFNGVNVFFARNHIHDVGLYYPSSVGLSAYGSNNHIYRNEIHEVPYCGMTVGKTNILVEENLIYHVMLELHDGAAIYASGAVNCTFRGNVARDIKVAGKGEGVSSYYLDEGSHDCIVEKNVSINVERPTHNYIAHNSIIRDNVFISDEDMNLSFPLCAKYTFQGNTVITPGKVRITSPGAVTDWKDNKIISNGRDLNGKSQAFTIDSAMPAFPNPTHKTRPIVVMRSIKTPIPDGDLATNEWPGEYYRLDRQPSRQPASGAPVIVRFSWDNKFLYVGAEMIMFELKNISQENKWGKGDGVEISIKGLDKGKPATFVIRGYVNGTLQSVTDAGASEPAAERLRQGVRYSSKVVEKPRKEWIGEWAIPLDATGLKPKPDLKVAFNMCAFINEYDNWHCWEGTLGDSWQVDQAGILQFK